MRCEECGQKECCGADPKKAAADDLYEALDALINDGRAYEWHEVFQPMIKKARAALAKARGQS